MNPLLAKIVDADVAYWGMMACMFIGCMFGWCWSWFCVVRDLERKNKALADKCWLAAGERDDARKELAQLRAKLDKIQVLSK